MFFEWQKRQSKKKMFSKKNPVWFREDIKKASFFWTLCEHPRLVQSILKSPPGTSWDAQSSFVWMGWWSGAKYWGWLLDDQPHIYWLAWGWALGDGWTWSQAIQGYFGADSEFNNSPIWWFQHSRQGLSWKLVWMKLPHCRPMRRHRPAYKDPGVGVIKGSHPKKKAD